MLVNKDFIYIFLSFQEECFQDIHFANTDYITAI